MDAVAPTRPTRPSRRTEGAQDNYADAVLNGFTNDCGGHVEQYHFHGYPACFFNKNTKGTSRTVLPDRTPGTVVGYAFDGFPVKTPWETCTADAAGNYAYCATKRYPYFLGCYSGTPTTNR